MKRECETCIKRKTIYCPNYYECYDTKEKPHYQNRIMLLEENQKYKEVIDKAMSKLGRYADELTGNGNAYAVCVDLLDILKEVE